MKLFASLLIAIGLLTSEQAAAQAPEITETPQAIIESEDVFRVQRDFIVSGNLAQIAETSEDVSFEWDFGDGKKTKGQEIVHRYNETGEYTIQLTIKQANQDFLRAEKKVFVYNKFMLLLTDAVNEKERIENLIQSARKDGVHIELIDSYDSSTAFVSEEILSGKLTEREASLYDADVILMWTSKGSGINVLTRLSRERPTLQSIMSDKSIIVIAKRNLNTLGRIMKANYDIIQPKEIILIRSYELRNFLANESTEAFVKGLKSGLSDYKIINAESSKIGIWNSISHLVNFMITKGIPSNTIVLLLMLPIIVTLIALMKQVIGVTTFGMYTPSILTLSFLALGLKFGLVILTIISLTGLVVRRFIERFNLLHIPRVAIILSASTLIILFTLGLGTFLGLSQIASIAVFPMLIMTTLSEKFISAQSDKGFLGALMALGETTGVALICYFIVEWSWIQNTMLAYPELILVLIFINVLLGRWTGLRLLEYVRFREVMRHAEE